MQFDTTNSWFSGSHSQGDEFSHSPHKNTACALCHDPHKSVWHEDGGVKFVAPDEAGNMCTHCHQMQIRGTMGQIGLECADCHMPDASMKGTGATHLFRISTSPLTAAQNTFAADGKTWWNTDANGDGFLTLDLVCNKCHDNMTMDVLAKAAKGIHRQPGIVDLTVNHADALQVVKTTSAISVDFSLQAGALKGMKADWFVMCQGPKGWTSWNGKKWVAGVSAWKKKTAANSVLADISKPLNVLKAKLAPGYYTYWVCIYPTDGSQNTDSVPVFVTR